MKFLKLLLIIFFFYLIIACEKENKKIDIRGDWYTYYFSPDSLGSLKKDYHNFIYKEEYFTDSIIFSYLSLANYISPSKFRIKYDSVFSAFGIENSDYRYKGKIKMVSNDHFIFYDDLFAVNYFRLADTTEVLSKYIIINLNSDNPMFNDPNIIFGRAFRERLNNRYSKIIDTINKEPQHD